jgi:hypothetical protein
MLSMLLYVRGSGTCSKSVKPIASATRLQRYGRLNIELASVVGARTMTITVNIEANDYWVKVVEFLQQNWALIEPVTPRGVCVYFISDSSGVFDELPFHSKKEAIEALKRNGFRHYAGDEELQSFLHLPLPPYRRASHPNGPIYSSGRFWKT